LNCISPTIPWKPLPSLPWNEKPVREGFDLLWYVCIMFYDVSVVSFMEIPCFLYFSIVFHGIFLNFSPNLMCLYNRSSDAHFEILSSWCFTLTLYNIEFPPILPFSGENLVKCHVWNTGQWRHGHQRHGRFGGEGHSGLCPATDAHNQRGKSGCTLMIDNIVYFCFFFETVKYNKQKKARFI